MRWNARLEDWLDARTGYRSIRAHALEEPVAGGARWAYVFGSALAVTFFIQAATGMLLLFYYSPSSQEAWGSVYYLNTHVRLGWFVRGLHHFGSSAMVVLLVLHILQVFVYGAYRKPRELGWWTGCLLLFITLAFSLTGYLLPWDQKGYWATQVVASIAGALPWVGSWLRAVLFAGVEFGNLTLTRFFGLHAFLLPASLMLVLLVHLTVFRKHGVTPHWRRPAAELSAAREPFWPRQVTYDLAFASIVLAVVVGIVLFNHGASLEAPADPASNYLARPEWYFLWLFQFLHFLPGDYEGPGILVFAIFAGVFLVSLPLADRSPTASLRDRWLHFVAASVLATFITGFTVWPMVRDARDPGVMMQRKQADADARRAFALAAQGIPPGGAADLYLNDPHERGWRLFVIHCQSCHKAHGQGGQSAPDLTDYMSRAWVRGVIADPTRASYFGHTKVTGMDPTQATPRELDVLTDYVLSLGGIGPAPADGASLFEEQGCSACHARAGEEPLAGPSLAGYGSRAWIAGVIKEPGHPAYYGEQNQMPAFADTLTHADIDDLIKCVTSKMMKPTARR